MCCIWFAMFMFWFYFLFSKMYGTWILMIVLGNVFLCKWIKLWNLKNQISCWFYLMMLFYLCHFLRSWTQWAWISRVWKKNQRWTTRGTTLENKDKMRKKERLWTRAMFLSQRAPFYLFCSPSLFGNQMSHKEQWGVFATNNNIVANLFFVANN